MTPARIIAYNSRLLIGEGPGPGVGDDDGGSDGAG